MDSVCRDRLIGIPVGLKIGHMPISLGEKIYLNNERSAMTQFSFGQIP